MPFTFSHPAIIIPVYKFFPRWVSLTCLISGSVAPDFEYFIRMRLQGNIGHTFPGLFSFDLPLGIFLAFLFHNVVRNPLIANSPELVRQKLGDYRFFNWNLHFLNHWIIAIVSVLIGASSHLFWDGWTHRHGIFVEFIPMLRTPVSIFGYVIPLYRVLQHVSTLFGGALIVYYFFKIPNGADSPGDRNRWYWPLIALIAICIIILRFYLKSEEDFLSNLIVVSIAAVLISLVIVPFMLNKEKLD
ncbi:DUF4184 family protein [soil metagenome]